MSFIDCKTDVERNQYKRSGRLKQEFDKKNKIEQPEFYRTHVIGGYCDVFRKICELVTIEPGKEGQRFTYFIDPQYLFDTTRGYRFENFTIDYRRIVEYGLEELKYPEEELTNKFTVDYNNVLDSLQLLAGRIVEKETKESRKKYFKAINICRAKGFEEALQRILFVNQMLWQMGHRLIGLGHLDSILWDVYKQELGTGKLTREDALAMLMDFLRTLHEYYWLKSNVLMGDTGQIIILGTRDSEGKYQCNDLTYLFIEALQGVQFPDPKILLRVSKDMPRDLMELALSCIQTGIGSPILSNDDVIIPKLETYGIKPEDAGNYGTSACWEPLIPGKSISPNNIAHLVYPQVLREVFENQALWKLETFEKFMETFYRQLYFSIRRIEKSVSEFRLQYNPLLSIFMDECYQAKRDVSAGGAKYNNYGITTVGLSNTVNSILNIKQYVYEEQRFSLEEVCKVLQMNYAGFEGLQEELKDKKQKYGVDDAEVIQLTKNILVETTKATDTFRNYLGGCLKFGVSAPTYIDATKDFPATFDGRKQGEAFGVHISSDKSDGYTEVINFAGALDYGDNRFNGNVVDFMVSPHFIEQNFDKFVTFLMLAIEVGFFQLQMNVISSEKLMAARKNPELYPNLIVRVWGFSAYFHELPEEYKEVLIQRAIEHEGKNNCN